MMPGITSPARSRLSPIFWATMYAIPAADSSRSPSIPASLGFAWNYSLKLREMVIDDHRVPGKVIHPCPEIAEQVSRSPSPIRSAGVTSWRTLMRKRIPARSIAWQRIEPAAMPSASWCAKSSIYSCRRICSATVSAMVSSDMGIRTTFLLLPGQQNLYVLWFVDELFGQLLASCVVLHEPADLGLDEVELTLVVQIFLVLAQVPAQPE